MNKREFIKRSLFSCASALIGLTIPSLLKAEETKPLIQACLDEKGEVIGHAEYDYVHKMVWISGEHIDNFIKIPDNWNAHVSDKSYLHRTTITFGENSKIKFGTGIVCLMCAFKPRSDKIPFINKRDIQNNPQIQTLLLSSDQQENV